MRRRTRGVVVTDQGASMVWTWLQRSAVFAGAVGAGLWWFFGFYSSVQGLQSNVTGLSTRVEALWQGQGTIMNSISDLKKSVETIPKKK